MAVQQEKPFIAGPDAPSPEDVITQQTPILDVDGERMIDRIHWSTDKERSEQQVVLDLNGPEPVIFFRDAIAVVRAGRLTETGFSGTGQDDTRTGVTYVNGEYRGPGSELELSYTIPGIVQPS